MKSSKINRKSSYLYRLIFSYLFVLLDIVKGLVLIPLYLNSFSLDLYGAWVASGQIVAYLGMLDLGLSDVINQKVANSYGNGSYKRVASFSTAGVLIGVCLSILIGLSGFIISDWIPNFIDVEKTYYSILKPAIKLQVVATSVRLCGFFLSSVILALQRTLANVITNFFSYLIGIGITIYGIYNGWGLLSIPIGYLTYSIIFLIVVSFFLIYYWYKDVGLLPKINYKELKSLGSLSGFVFLGKIGNNLIKRSDAIIISKVMGSRFTSIYNVNSQISNQAKVVPQKIAALIIPSLSHFVGERGVDEKSKQISLDVLSISIGIASSLTAGIIALNKAFIFLWVGNELFYGISLIIGVSLYMFLEVGRDAASNLLFSIGEIKIPSILTLVEAFIKVIFMILGVKWLGLLGAPIGAIISLLLVNGVYLIRIYIKEFMISGSEIKDRTTQFIIAPLVIFGIGIFWYFVFFPKTWISFILNIMVLGIIIICILLNFYQNIFFVTKEYFKSFVSQIRRDF